MINFHGINTNRLSLVDYRLCAGQYNVETALVQAVVKVEAGTAGFWNSGEIKLLYEGHIAYKETSGALRAKLVKAGLAWKNWGDKAYGKATQSRDRLRKAIEIAGDRAYRWASYGLGQIMGFNAELCGYVSAKAMFDKFLKGEPHQLDGMMRFIKASNLLAPMRAKDWHKFARGYNGSGYTKHSYHIRLEQAYASFAKGQPVDAWADGILTIGDKGEAVEVLQRQLVALGADIEIDGAFGRGTAQAVIEVQKKLGLKADGIVGSKTNEALTGVEVEEPAPLQAPVEEVSAITNPVNPGPFVVGTGLAGGVGFIIWKIVEAIFL
ncbi:N-acetylmuramidase domain-containing protein [Mesorhizobium sp. WSM2239]|uniref:N-acetylmuramidase domain-containing protein n=2 Tax=unclassified Mesorhizobium TaxID=325217 RepID=A0AAU8D0G4_9HYPH